VLAVLVAAASPARGEEEIRVCVVSIIATQSNDKVHPKLERLAREVQKTHPELTGFRVARVSRQSMAVGGKKDFELIEKQLATITLDPPADKDKPYRIKVTPPQMGEITYTSTCGKYLPILTPFRTKENDVLIIAIRVSPCQQK
jgi:hypothetical protein